MAVYTIYIPDMPQSDQQDRDQHDDARKRQLAAQAVAIRDGFSFFAFAIPPLWMLFSKLWYAFVASLTC